MNIIYNKISNQMAISIFYKSSGDISPVFVYKA